MADCIYCGEQAGLLKKKNPACEEAYDEGWAEMVSTARSALDSTSFSGLQQRLTNVATSHRVPKELVRTALVAVWTSAVDTALNDQLLTKQEENALISFQHEFALSQ